MSNLIIEKLLAKTKRTDLPEFVPGDTIRVHVKIREGDKERVQAFEGVVISQAKGPQAQLHGAQDQLRTGRRAYLPDELQGDRPGGIAAFVEGTAREALLPARVEGQGCPFEGRRSRARGPGSCRHEVARRLAYSGSGLSAEKTAVRAFSEKSILRTGRTCLVLVGLFSCLAAMFELLQQVLQDGAIALADFSKFDSHADVERRVAHLSLEGQIVIGDVQDEFQIRAGQQQGSWWSPSSRPRKRPSIYPRDGRDLRLSAAILRHPWLRTAGSGADSPPGRTACSTRRAIADSSGHTPAPYRPIRRSRASFRLRHTGYRPGPARCEFDSPIHTTRQKALLRPRSMVTISPASLTQRKPVRRAPCEEMS